MINLQTRVVFDATGQQTIINAFQVMRQQAILTNQALDATSGRFRALTTPIAAFESGVMRLTSGVLKLQKVLTLVPGGGQRGSVFWATWGAQGLMDAGTALDNFGTKIIGMYARATVEASKYKGQLAEIVALEGRYSISGARQSEGQRVYRAAQAVGANLDAVAESRFQLASAPVRRSADDPTGRRAKDTMAKYGDMLTMVGRADPAATIRGMAAGINAFGLDPIRDSKVLANTYFGLDRAGFLRINDIPQAVSKIGPAFAGMTEDPRRRTASMQEGMALWALGTDIGMKPRESATAASRVLDLIFKSANPDTSEGRAHRRIFGDTWTPESAFRMGLPTYFRKLSEGGLDPYTDVKLKPAARLMSAVMSGYRTSGENGGAAGLGYEDILGTVRGTNDLEKAAGYMGQQQEQQINRLRNAWKNLVVQVTDGAAPFIKALTGIVEFMGKLPGVQTVTTLVVGVAALSTGLGRFIGTMGRLYNMIARLSVFADGVVNHMTSIMGGPAAALNTVSSQYIQSQGHTPSQMFMPGQASGGWHAANGMNMGTAKGIGIGGLGPGAWVPYGTQQGAAGGTWYSSSTRYGMSGVVSRLMSIDPEAANFMAQGILSEAPDKHLVDVLGKMRGDYASRLTETEGNLAENDMARKDINSQMLELDNLDANKEWTKTQREKLKASHKTASGRIGSEYTNAVTKAKKEHKARLAEAESKRLEPTLDPALDTKYTSAVQRSQDIFDRDIATITAAKDKAKAALAKSFDKELTALNASIENYNKKIAQRPQLRKILEGKLSKLQSQHTNLTNMRDTLQNSIGTLDTFEEEAPPSKAARRKMGIGEFANSAGSAFSASSLGQILGFSALSVAIGATTQLFNDLIYAGKDFRDSLRDFRLTPEQAADVAANPSKYAAPPGAKGTTRAAWNQAVESFNTWEEGNVDLTDAQKQKKLAEAIGPAMWSWTPRTPSGEKAKLRDALKQTGIFGEDLPPELVESIYKDALGGTLPGTNNAINAMLMPEMGLSGKMDPDKAAKAVMSLMRDLKSGKRSTYGASLVDLGGETQRQLEIYKNDAEELKAQYTEQQRELQDMLTGELPDKNAVAEATARLRQTGKSLYDLYGEMGNLITVARGKDKADPELRRLENSIATDRRDAFKMARISDIEKQYYANQMGGNVAREEGALGKMRRGFAWNNLSTMTPETSLQQLEAIAQQQERILRAKLEMAELTGNEADKQKAIAELEDFQLQVATEKVEKARQLAQAGSERVNTMLDIQKSYSDLLVESGAPQSQVKASRQRESQLRQLSLQTMLAMAKAAPAGPERDKLMLDYQKQRIAYAREELDVQKRQNEAIGQFLSTLRETMVARAMVMRRGMPDFSDFMVGMKTSFAYMQTMKDYLGNMRVGGRFFSGGMAPSLASSGGNYNAARAALNVSPTFNIPVYAQSDAAKALDIINRTLVPQIQRVVSNSFGSAAARADAQAQYTNAQSAPRYSGVPAAANAQHTQQGLFDNWGPFAQGMYDPTTGYHPSKAGMADLSSYGSTPTIAGANTSSYSPGYAGRPPAPAKADRRGYVHAGGRLWQGW